MADGRPIRIVAIEDNRADVELLRHVLEARGTSFDLTQIADGEEAAEYAQGREPWRPGPPPDIILLDLRLPKIDGDVVLGYLKENGQLKQVPVLVLTSSESPEELRKVELLGARQWMTKPFDLDGYAKIAETIERLAARSAGVGSPVNRPS